MKRFVIGLLGVGLAIVSASAQTKGEKALRHGTMTEEEMERMVRMANSNVVVADAPPPLWSYSTVSSRDNKTYTGISIGKSPFGRGLTTSNIPTVIVPLIITVKGVTLDPTAVLPGSCAYPAAWNGKTPVQLTMQSPIFTATSWTMNGQNVGTGQYVDAFQRAEYWSKVQGSGWHTVLSPVTVLGAVTVPNSAIDPSSVTAKSACLTDSDPADQISVGPADTGLLTPWLEGTLIPNLRSQGMINSGQFVYFLFYNTTFSDAYGFHSFVGNQSYAISFINGSDCCYPDIKTMSHEVAEWMNDPYPNNTQNLTPLWVSQADNEGNTSACQNNFEVGDPSSVHLFPDVTMPNGVTYHPQELTFFSWFYGAPSIGAGNMYSNNNSFGSDAGGICVVPPPNGAVSSAAQGK